MANLKKSKEKSHNLRKVLPLYAEHKKSLIIASIFIVITGVLGIFIPIISANILSNIADSNFEKAINLALIFLALSIFRIIFNGITESLYIRINARVSGLFQSFNPLIALQKVV